MPVALALMLADCVSPHLLHAFVYVFRGRELGRERRGRKDTDQTAASAECGARKLDFEMRAVCSRGGCLTCLFCVASLSIVNKCAQQMRANALGKHEGQRRWHSCSLRSVRIPCFVTFLLLLQRSPNSASLNELLLKKVGTGLKCAKFGNDRTFRC